MKEIWTLTREVCTDLFVIFHFDNSLLMQSGAMTFQQEEKRDIFEQCCRECFYCHKKLVFKNSRKDERGAWNADHLIPDARDGATTIINEVAACFDCNSKKSAMTHTQFIKKFGGLGKIGSFVRCHGFKKDGYRCSYCSKKQYRDKHYIVNVILHNFVRVFKLLWNASYQHLTIISFIFPSLLL